MDDQNIQGKISESLIEKVREYLGSEGKEDFLHFYQKYGTVSPVFMDEGLPHPVHFREGMQVRNFMRGLPECQGWNSHEFDNTWAPIVAQAIGVPTE